MINKFYITIAGIALIALILIAFMWLDNRRFEKSLETEIKDLPLVTKTDSVSNLHSPDNAKNVVQKAPVQQKPPKNINKVRENKTSSPNRSIQSLPERTGKKVTQISEATYDWMFEKGEDVEAEQPKQSKRKTIKASIE